MTEGLVSGSSKLLIDLPISEAGRDNTHNVIGKPISSGTDVATWPPEDAPRGRHDKEAFMALCNRHYTHMSLAVKSGDLLQLQQQSVWLKEDVESVTLISWVNFARDRIVGRRKDMQRVFDAWLKSTHDTRNSGSRR